MTGGGSESILTMMKASRDYARYVRGNRQPEMIIGDSAHAAYFKGAEYFKIKLVMVPVGPDYRLSGKAVQKAVTRNTILVIASAPGFPHGVIDHIQDIAKVRLLLVYPPLRRLACSSGNQPAEEQHRTSKGLGSSGAVQLETACKEPHTALCLAWCNSAGVRVSAGCSKVQKAPCGSIACMLAMHVSNCMFSCVYLYHTGLTQEQPSCIPNLDTCTSHMLCSLLSLEPQSEGKVFSAS